MKKYISAILINALLLQFVGCYSQKEITYDEFYSLPKPEDATIKTNDGQSFDLNSDSTKHDYIRWEKVPDTLKIFSTHLEKYSSKALIEVTDTVRYPKEDISKIFVDEFDESTTIIAIAIPVVLIGLIIIGMSNMEFEMKGWEK
jgi:hypothetical protein